MGDEQKCGDCRFCNIDGFCELKSKDVDLDDNACGSYEED